MTSLEKIAKILRTSEKVISDLEKKMEKVSGKKGVIEKIIQENDEKVREKLEELSLRGAKKIPRFARNRLRNPVAEDKSTGLPRLGFAEAHNNSGITAKQVYSALIEKVKQTDQALFKHFHSPEFCTATGCQTLTNATKELVGKSIGSYLKKEKAAELLKLNPPKNIMAVLGYGTDIEKMLAKEDVFEIFAALRFVEEEAWLNNVFLKTYENLKKDDFEEREIKIMVLPERWLSIGRKFLGKKLHHMSHLKELGLVFVIPVESQWQGETLYLFFMTLHYLYEVDWHSKLFKEYSRQKGFALKLISALKVEVTGFPLPDKEKMSWRIVAKYLGKKDPNDPRLLEPHISPEALHYYKVNQALQRYDKRFPELGLGFWENLDWVAERFSDGSGGEEALISFDLYDNGIALLKQSGFESKYLYHQEEALWNKIFMEYMGEKKMDELMMKNLDRGYITLS